MSVFTPLKANELHPVLHRAKYLAAQDEETETKPEVPETPAPSESK